MTEALWTENKIVFVPVLDYPSLQRMRLHRYFMRALIICIVLMLLLFFINGFIGKFFFLPNRA